MDTALMEITLVILTTLAPAGIVAYAMLSVGLLRGELRENAVAVSRWLIVPLVFPLLGFVASATHLGTPANALYVLTGVGRSPLSNEVAAVVVFLLLGGCYWILAFSEKPIGRGKRVMLGVLFVSALVALFFIGRAYSVYTIPTWDMPLAPVTLWLDGLSSGPALAIFALLCARVLPSKRVFSVCIGITVVAALANVACLAGEAALLPSIQTTVHTASQLVPHFTVMIVAYGLLELIAVLGLAMACRKVEQGVDAKRRYWATLGCAAGALACACAASFLVRFWFYCMHMTVGI